MNGGVPILYVWMDEFDPSCPVQENLKETLYVDILDSIHAGRLRGVSAFGHMPCHTIEIVCFTGNLSGTFDQLSLFVNGSQKDLVLIAIQSSALLSPNTTFSFLGCLHHEESPKENSLRMHVKVQGPLFDAHEICYVPNKHLRPRGL